MSGIRLATRTDHRRSPHRPYVPRKIDRDRLVIGEGRASARKLCEGRDARRRRPSWPSAMTVRVAGSEAETASPSIVMADHAHKVDFRRVAKSVTTSGQGPVTTCPLPIRPVAGLMPNRTGVSRGAHWRRDVRSAFSTIGYPLPSTWGRSVAASRRACRARAWTTHGPSRSS